MGLPDRVHGYSEWISTKVSGKSDDIIMIILDTLSGWPMHTMSNYLLSVWLIWQRHKCNIEYFIRQIHGYTEWISTKGIWWIQYHYKDNIGCSVRLTHVYTLSEYVFSVQRIQQQHECNIEYSIRLTRGYTEWMSTKVYSESNNIIRIILDTLLGWPMHTMSKYPLHVRWIWP